MIYIISDDQFFCLGVTEVLTASGYEATSLYIHDVDFIWLIRVLNYTDIILHTFITDTQFDCIIRVVAACHARQICVVSGRMGTEPAKLWGCGMISKKIPLHHLCAVVIHIAESNFVAWREELTKRERQTLNMYLTGKSGHRISIEMGLSVKTVSKHKIHGLHKLGLEQLNARSLIIYGKYRKMLSQAY